MWIGFFVELIMILVMLILLIIKQIVPDILEYIFCMGMFVCLITSFLQLGKMIVINGTRNILR